MSDSSEENDSGAEEATINGDTYNGTEDVADIENGPSPTRGRISELLQEEREGASTPEQLGNGVNRYKAVQQPESASEDGSLDTVPRRAGSPIDSLLSVPDDSPSVQVGWPASYSDSANFPRDPYSLLLVEVAYDLHLPLDLASKAPLHLSGPSTDDSSLASRALPSPFHAPNHLASSKDIPAMPLSLAISCQILETPTPRLHRGKLYDGRSSRK